MTGQLSLRAITSGDQPFLLALVDSTRDDLSVLDRTLRGMLVRLQHDAQASDYRRRFPRMEQNLVLADGAPAGRLYVARGTNEIRLVDISLLPAYRSQSIGASLLARLQDESRLSGLPLRLHVLQASPAVRLYRRLGFQPGAVDGLYQAMEWHPLQPHLSKD